MQKILTLVLLIAALPHLAMAGESSGRLVVGDPAPAIENADWYRGEQIESWIPGHVYVIDFWATWCPPCIKGLQHLQTLNQQWASHGVHFIAIAIWPTEKSRPPEEVLGRFPQLAFSLAIDDGTSTADAFMDPTRSSGLPNTMIIDRRGRLAWVGEPGDGFEQALETVVGGDYDIDKARTADLVRHRSGEYLASASEAEKAEQYREAIEFIDRAVAVDPARFSVYRGWQYEIALLRLGDPVLARKIADGLLDSAQGDNPYPLFVLAARIVNNYEGTPAGQRDLDLALRCARKSVDNSAKPDYERLALLAKVHALRGEYRLAATSQRGALDLAEGSEERSARETLDEYLRLADGSPD